MISPTCLQVERLGGSSCAVVLVNPPWVHAHQALSPCCWWCATSQWSSVDIFWPGPPRFGASPLAWPPVPFLVLAPGWCQIFPWGPLFLVVGRLGSYLHIQHIAQTPRPIFWVRWWVPGIMIGKGQSPVDQAPLIGDVSGRGDGQERAL